LHIEFQSLNNMMIRNSVASPPPLSLGIYIPRWRLDNMHNSLP